jgi:hypothetical protein
MWPFRTLKLPSYSVGVILLPYRIAGVNSRRITPPAS